MTWHQVGDNPLPEKMFTHMCPSLLTWFDFNPSMDKQLHPLQHVGWNFLFIPKLQRLHRWSLGMDK